MNRNDELDREYAKQLEIQRREIESNPLLQYSTSELKRELRRRKGKEQ